MIVRRTRVDLSPVSQCAHGGSRGPHRELGNIAFLADQQLYRTIHCAMSTILSLRKLFAYYQELGTKAIAQVPDADLVRVLAPEGNSVSLLVKHLAGNMRSRFTDFLTSDGEKPWRDREGEFEGPHATRAALMGDWNSGWTCLFAVLDALSDADLERIVLIRNEGHSVQEALHRQLAHYAYHVGQIVLLARTFAGAEWTSLSIPRGGSQAFNAERFAKPAERRQFTDGSGER